MIDSFRKKGVKNFKERSRGLRIRDRLALVLLMLAVPLTALHVYGSNQDAAALTAEARADARRLALSVAREHTQMLAGVRDILKTVGSIAEIRSGTAPDCLFILRDLTLDSPRFSALARVERTGRISCSSIGSTTDISQEDRPFFQRALNDRNFSVSRHMTGRLSGHPVIGALYPVLDDSLQVEYFVYGGLELDWLNDVLQGVEAAPETELVILDSRGIVVASYPAQGEWTGRPFPDASITDRLLIEELSTAEGLGLDGQARLFGFARLGSGTERGMVSVSLPLSAVSLPAQDALRRDILAMVGVIMVGILGAGIVANRYILKPIAVLSAAVKRFRAGDFRGHIGIGLGGEFEDLAEAFNDMARRLQEKAPRT